MSDDLVTNGVRHTPYHDHGAAHVIKESVRLYPLDLPSRLRYLDDQAWSARDKNVRREILSHVRAVRGM